MIRRGMILLALGCGLGLLFATWLQPRAVQGGDAPRELLADPAPPTRQSLDLSKPFVAATRKVRPAVVQVLNYAEDRRGKLHQQGSGSGFVFSKDGHILTNRHVVLNASRLAIKLHDGTLLAQIEVLGADPRSDIAVLRYTGDKTLPVAELGDSDRVEVGEWAIAIGAPFELASTVSAGIVSAVGRTGVLADRRTPDFTQYSEAFIQTDAALNPGNSGGPLINLDGQVIGINTAIETGREGRSNIGIGFAIPVNLARTIAIALIERGVAKRGWMGAMVGYGKPSVLKEHFGVDLPGALVITSVIPDSPAARAGLQKHDVLAQVDGHSLQDGKMLGARLSQAGPGGTISIAYYRDGKKGTVKLTLAEEPVDTYGMQVKSLDAATARELGLPANLRGAVVTKVDADSPATRHARARVYPGDVIYRIDTRFGRFTIRSDQDFERVMLMQPAFIKIAVATKDGRREFFLKRWE